MTSSARQLLLVVVAALAAKGVVLGGALWMPLAPDALGIQADPAASFVERLCQWDCGWYVDIMTRGYAEEPPAALSGEANWAFFPAFPVLGGMVAAVLGLPPLVAAVLLNCCLAVAATLLL